MQVAIHAGVAFTDEGRVLNSLKKNQSTLAANGVAFFGPRRYKTTFKPVFDGWETDPNDVTLHQNLKNILAAGSEIERVIFSSESFVGELGATLLEGQLYPLAGQRMALLDEIYHDHEIELFLGLCNPGSFIPKLLMALPEKARADIIKNTDLSCLSWIGMLEDIRDLAPNIQITLWSNEDSPFIWGDVVRAVAGLSEGSVLVDERDLLLSLLDETGQNKFQALTDQDPQLSRASLHDNMARIFEDHGQPERIEEELDLPGWSNEIVDAFSELYEQDIDRLGEMPGVRVFKP